MAKTNLISAEYWEGDDVDIRLNPAMKNDITGLKRSLRECEITSAIVLATSGTCGAPKFVVLAKKALLRSAKAVNQWCNITKEDVWLGGLSTFHVGGFGIYCRAFLSGSRVNSMQWSDWSRDGKAFLTAVKDSTVTSLTPVHLHDLVSSGVCCPDNLRGVFIGGGALHADLAKKARDLDWPLWTTYGMTEACSQIATSLEGDTEWLPVLPHWSVKTADSHELMIKGPSLMSGYFTNDWVWHPVSDFYTTGDLAEIRNGRLRPLGRADDQVKILGELVSPTKLELSLSAGLGVNAVVFHTPDSRRGAILKAVLEAEEDVMNEFVAWNDSQAPFETISEVYFSQSFPKQTLVKSIEAK